MVDDDDVICIGKKFAQRTTAIARNKNVRTRRRQPGLIQSAHDITATSHENAKRRFFFWLIRKGTALSRTWQIRPASTSHPPTSKQLPLNLRKPTRKMLSNASSRCRGRLGSLADIDQNTFNFLSEFNEMPGVAEPPATRTSEPVMAGHLQSPPIDIRWRNPPRPRRVDSWMT